MNLSSLSPKQLLEIDACTHCGDCLKLCPVYSQRGEEGINPRGKIQAMKKFIRSQHGLWAKIFGPKKLSEEQLKKFSEMVNRCTLCGECGLGCPVSIDSRNLWLALREVLVDLGYFPQEADTLRKNLLREHNILGQENAWRTEWLESMGDVPEHRYQKEKADVIFFVGCVSAYFPMVYKVTQSFVKILNRVNVDFALLGAEEWCCGFPLIAAGMRKVAQELIQHNIDKVKEKGAKRVVFACPSCYHTWHEEYNSEIPLLHATQFILELIREGKIQFREEKVQVTYHDPCDLGRVSGIYQPPREILRAMPGVELVEMADHGEHCKCCGGGGNLEMVDPELSAALAREKIKQIQATGTPIVITACQQCIRTIMTTARREKIPIKAHSITEFVLKQMK
ncbi:MAG: (Fe-S)-binding protein [Deltaproteobacteria bacterium]